MRNEKQREYHRKYMAEYRKKYPEKCREFVRNSFKKNRAKYRAQGLRYMKEKLAANPGMRTKMNLKWRAANKTQWNAYQSVRLAVKSRRLTKPEFCQMCLQVGVGHNGIEAHHHKGYDKANRLDVVWLCSPCHCEVEGRINNWVRAA